MADLQAMIAAKKSTELRDVAQTAVLGALQGRPAVVPVGVPLDEAPGFGFSAAGNGVGGGMSMPLSARDGLAAPVGSAGPTATAEPAQGGTLVLRLRPGETAAQPAHPEAPGAAAAADLSRLPAELDARMEQRDPEGRLRPTILSVSESWRQRRQRGLLSPPQESPLLHQGQVLERDKCNDLLDALSRSGLLAFEDVQVHLVLAATHSFDATLMDTLVVQNTNPIDKVEHSTLIVAEAVFGLPKEQLVVPAIQSQ